MMLCSYVSSGGNSLQAYIPSLIRDLKRTDQPQILPQKLKIYELRILGWYFSILCCRGNSDVGLVFLAFVGVWEVVLSVAGHPQPMGSQGHNRK